MLLLLSFATQLGKREHRKHKSFLDSRLRGNDNPFANSINLFNLINPIDSINSNNPQSKIKNQKSLPAIARRAGAIEERV